MSNPVIKKEHFLQANCQLMQDIKADMEKEKSMSEEKKYVTIDMERLDMAVELCANMSRQLSGGQESETAFTHALKGLRHVIFMAQVPEYEEGEAE